jgi:hypothetical protein
LVKYVPRFAVAIGEGRWAAGCNNEKAIVSRLRKPNGTAELFVGPASEITSELSEQPGGRGEPSLASSSSSSANRAYDVCFEA